MERTRTPRIRFSPSIQDILDGNRQKNEPARESADKKNAIALFVATASATVLFGTYWMYSELAKPLMQTVTIHLDALSNAQCVSDPSQAPLLATMAGHKILAPCSLIVDKASIANSTFLTTSLDLGKAAIFLSDGAKNYAPADITNHTFIAITNSPGMAAAIGFVYNNAPWTSAQFADGVKATLLDSDPTSNTAQVLIQLQHQVFPQTFNQITNQITMVGEVAAVALAVSGGFLLYRGIKKLLRKNEAQQSSAVQSILENNQRV